jgi:thiol-disulfide isomerase/thioredoxin
MGLMKRLAALLIGLAFASAAMANPEGDALIARIRGLKPPAWDRAKTSQEEFMKRSASFTKDRNDLIWKLFLADPDNPATPDLMLERWDRFEGGRVVIDGEYRKRLQDDVDKVLAMRPSLAIVEVAKYSLASIKVGGWISDPQIAIDVCGQFASEFPKSKRASILYMTASQSMSRENRPPLFRDFVARFPNDDYALMARGAIRQEEEMRKPFALIFNDAITGRAVDVAKFRGKVVLIDFWATWCGRCVEAIPNLKRLRQTYGAQGFEIVGVSLDVAEKEGGLQKLKEFATKNGLDWPQYYEGAPVLKSFAASWGISAIPTVFLLDRNGMLREVNVRDAEASIKRLLAEKG